MFSSILVPLDGHTPAEQALPLAASIAERNRAVLHLAVVHLWGAAEDASVRNSGGSRAKRPREPDDPAAGRGRCRAAFQAVVNVNSIP